MKRTNNRLIMVTSNRPINLRTNNIRQITFVLIIVIPLSICQMSFNIGGTFSSVSTERIFTNAIAIANKYPYAHGLGSVRLNYSTSLLRQDPIATLKGICNDLVNSSVHLVVTDRQINNTRPPFIVSYACAFYNIPVIGVASRESQFSDKVNLVVSGNHNSSLLSFFIHRFFSTNQHHHHQQQQ